ncbi:protein TASOR isoform X2 [Mixophyes fleayi]|uniref:protein TASOR isoform X2 n=1 Tax=Mixophyes fleayi TaxID=3061075 RepID=UPI003F4D7B1B
MEKEKPSAVRDGSVGGGSTRLVVEEARIGVEQNGELAQAEEAAAAEKTDYRRRHSSFNSEHMKAENNNSGGGKGVSPPEEPPRKRFQIPRKSREKKALQPISSDSREFEEILNILHSSFLDANSKIYFTYKTARVVHNEFLEKEFTEKRRQLKFDGRLEKELVESYAFLLVDEEQVHRICEKGLHVGHSRVTTLGKPSMGVYLSKFSDLVQANPLESGASGSIFIFKVIKGKMKAIYDNFRNNQDSLTGNGNLDPAPKHECHVLKNLNAVTSLLSYRAFERTQYYFYEYGFDEILKRPRHVCPYAVVSFGYKVDQKPRQSSSPLPGAVSFTSDRYNDRNFILWRGQLLSKGKLLCYASLKSTNGPFFPYKLAEKIDLEIVMRLEQIKKRIPSLLFYKETHKTKEVVKGGLCSSLYEVSDKTRTGNDLQGLLQKLEKEKLALVKPLADRGFLLLYFPTPMTTSYGVQSTKSFPLHALFIYPESRESLQPASHVKVQPYFMPENHEILPDLLTFIASLHSALIKCQKDTSDNFNIVVEKHLRIYLKRRAEGTYKRKDCVLRVYDQRLDCRKNLYTAPKDRSRIHPGLNSYIRGSEAYILPVDRAKELIMENRRVQQFSPVSDYEPIEDDHDVPTSMTRESVRERLSENTDYDMDKLKGLINLIYIKKNNTSNNPEIEEASNSGLKRKLESSPETTEWKHHKTEDYIKCFQETAEPSHSVSSFISALGGQDTDLRQGSPEPESNTTDPEYYKVLFEKLSDSGLLDSLNKLLPDQNRITDETVKMDLLTSVDAVASSADYEQSTYTEQQSVAHLESNVSLAVPPVDDGGVGKEAGRSDHLYPYPAEESILEPFSGCVSPCPSTPTEQVYPQQNPSSSNVECEMHWKLIPITGEEGRAPEDHVGNLRAEKQQGLSLTEEQLVYLSPNDALPNDPRAHHIRRCRGPGCSPVECRKGKRRSSRNEKGPYRDRTTKRGHDFFKSKHCQNGVIETTVQEVYSKFSEQLQELLRERDISFTGTSPPLLSSDERVVRLSDWFYAQNSTIPVQQYVDELRVKLDSVVNSYISISDSGRSIGTDSETKKPLESLGQQADSISVPVHTNMDISQMPEPLQSSDLIRNGCIDQVPLNNEDAPAGGNPCTPVDALPQTSQDIVPQNPETSTSDLPDGITASHTALADLINQMHPEVFNNLVKIFTHVNKNIVKFYIHAEQEENAICCEIKDYLIKLGNLQCYPAQFLHCNADSDKLLIIIQNEDIAQSIHKIPSLITLKRRPCVSFAGVDSLDDLKNHTYNELFVSGGFIVSDETVLSPDPVTVDELKKFLLFLEQINSPEGKWQWKIHCKFQKKLKELGRGSKHALNILALLNTYQKKHLVEILSYHNCDSQTRQAPELDCLIKLQVQNIQQRHLIFLTEKNASLFANYAENGIVVTKMADFMHNFTSLVGHHSSNSEENCLSHLVTQDNQTAPSEADEKEEEDMSLDSGDETPQIEVCTDTAKLEPCRDKSVSQSEFVLSQAEGPKSKTPLIGSDYRQLVTPGSTGDNSNTTGDELSKNIQDYHNRQSGISHFNLLTHQTFLGSMVYPILGTQTAGENYFPNSYNQSMEQQDTSQLPEWDPKWNVK